MAKTKDDPVQFDVGGFEKFVFPMIRSVWPNLTATDMLSDANPDGLDPLVKLIRQSRKYHKKKRNG